MTTVSHTLTGPGGVPAANAYVEIRLRAPDTTSPAYWGDNEILSRVVLHADSNGDWSTDLVPNSEITPDNTFYEIKQKFGGFASHYTYIVVPDGDPVRVTDDGVLIVPTDLTDPVYAGGGGGEFTGDAGDIDASNSGHTFLTDTDIQGQLDQTDTKFEGMGTASTAALDTDVTLGADSDTRIATQKATRAYVVARLAALVASAPSTLDTLNEIAAALGNDPNLATTLTTLIGTKASAAALATDVANLAAHISDATAAHDSSAIGFTPSGDITATDVHAAILQAAALGGGGGDLSNTIGDTLLVVADSNAAPDPSVGLLVWSAVTSTERLVALPDVGDDAVDPSKAVSMIVFVASGLTSDANPVTVQWNGDTLKQFGTNAVAAWARFIWAGEDNGGWFLFEIGPASAGSFDGNASDVPASDETHRPVTGANVQAQLDRIDSLLRFINPGGAVLTIHRAPTIDYNEDAIYYPGDAFRAYNEMMTAWYLVQVMDVPGAPADGITGTPQQALFEENPYFVPICLENAAAPVNLRITSDVPPNDDTYTLPAPLGSTLQAQSEDGQSAHLWFKNGNNDANWIDLSVIPEIALTDLSDIMEPRPAIVIGTPSSGTNEDATSYDFTGDNNWSTEVFLAGESMAVITLDAEYTLDDDGVAQMAADITTQLHAIGTHGALWTCFTIPNTGLLYIVGPNAVDGNGVVIDGSIWVVSPTVGANGATPGFPDDAQVFPTTLNDATERSQQAQHVALVPLPSGGFGFGVLSGISNGSHQVSVDATHGVLVDGNPIDGRIGPWPFLSGVRAVKVLGTFDFAANVNFDGDPLSFDIACSDNAEHIVMDADYEGDIEAAFTAFLNQFANIAYLETVLEDGTTPKLILFSKDGGEQAHLTVTNLVVPATATDFGMSEFDVNGSAHPSIGDIATDVQPGLAGDVIEVTIHGGSYISSNNSDVDLVNDPWGGGGWSLIYSGALTNINVQSITGPRTIKLPTSYGRLTPAPGNVLWISNDGASATNPITIVSDYFPIVGDPTITDERLVGFAFVNMTQDDANGSGWQRVGQPDPHPPFIVLGPGDDVPDGTSEGTLIVRAAL